MLKITSDQIDGLESSYPGIKEQILRFENASLPECPICESRDTAQVQIGIIGRTINISASTTKFKLIPDGPGAGKYFCNTCRKYFDAKGA